MARLSLKLVGLTALGLVFLGAACSKNAAQPTTNTPVANTNAVETENDPVGTIVVEARTGTLSGAEPSTMDFIAEIASGWVAYLGSKGATATFPVEATTTGTYTLWAKMSDDGTWDSGYRDANIFVNGIQVVTYQHVSKNTNGWVWTKIGNISLKAGSNTVAFTKANDMPAAFSTQALKFVPVAGTL